MILGYNKDYSHFVTSHYMPATGLILEINKEDTISLLGKLIYSQGNKLSEINYFIYSRSQSCRLKSQYLKLDQV